MLASDSARQALGFWCEAIVNFFPYTLDQINVSRKLDLTLISCAFVIVLY